MKKLIKAILLFWYKLLILPVAKKINTKISTEIPKIEISKIHIINAKLLTTRQEMLELLPKGGIVAELGVDEGGFSESILTINKPQKLHLVDYWGSSRYNKEKQRKVETRFEKSIEEKHVEINLGLSTQVVKEFQDEYFDWIYIDTAHTYKTTIEELELYRTKIKPDGFITGHDYILGNWNGLVRYGVIEAVYEFCSKYSWEIVFITTEINNSPSFAIRKITDHNNV